MIWDVININLYRKIMALFMSLICVMGLAGCEKDTGADRVLKYDVKSGTRDIDPQFSTSETAKIIIANTFEGLFRYNQQGEIENVMAETYTVSSDRLTYTFDIKKGVKWSDGTEVTANDFEFAFQRMFDLQALSPFAVNYTSIKNAEAILKGEMKKEALGVKAVDDHTLKIVLEKPNPYFISLLTHNASMPCNKDFLINAKGRYGLDKDHIIFNGPYTVKLWDNEEIRLRRNSEYYDKGNVVCAGVNLYINRGEPVELFLSGKSDCCFINEADIEACKNEKMQIMSFENITMQLIFNQNKKIFSDENIRKAMVQVLEPESIETDEFFKIEKNLIPKAVNTPIGNYRNIVGDIRYPSQSEKQNPKELIDVGYDNLGISDPGKITFIAPDSTAGRSAVIKFQEAWAKELSVYVNFEFLPENELLKRVRTSDYQIALVPVTPHDDSPLSVVSAFTTGNDLNYANMSDEEFDKTVDEAMHCSDLKTSLYLIHEAEQYLIDKAAVLPVFSSSRYFAMNEDVSDITVSIYDKTCFFKNAKRKD